MSQLLEEVAVDRAPLPASANAGGTSLSILFVIPGYPPVIGGAEMHASRLAAALGRRGHRVEVVTIATPPMPNEPRWSDPAGIPVRAIGCRLPPSLRPRAFVIGVAIRLLARRYDAIQIFLPGLHVVSALAVGALYDVPGAVMFGSPLEVPKLRATRFGRLQLATIRRLAQRVVVLNAEMKHDFLSIGVSPDRIIAHPCSMDPALFAPVTRSRVLELRGHQGLDPDAPVVVFTGRLAAQKGLPTLIDAFARVRQSLPNAILVLVGDGPLRESLEERAEQRVGRGVVQFAGKQSPDGVREYLQSADAFAFVSTSEGIPCSVIEAMSCGCACVVSDAPGVAQLIGHDIDGWIVPTDNAEATASALVRVLTDRELASRLGRAARERAITSFSSDVVAANHERMYREMMASRA
jgi:glycosyltransferase involved in cell wall biosynthesis